MRFFLISLLLLVNRSLWAEPVNESGTRTCQVLFLNKPVDSVDKAYLFDGTKSHAVELSGKGFSEVIELPSGLLTLFFSLGSVSDAEGLAKEAPSVQLPEEVSDFYLLLRSAPENEAYPYRMEIIDTSRGKLETGETLWMNLTKHNVSAEIGGESFQIPPEGQVVSSPPMEENGYYPVHFTYQRDGEGDFRSVFKRTWRHMKSAKSLGFVIDRDGRRPEIFTIRDRR